MKLILKSVILICCIAIAANLHAACPMSGGGGNARGKCHGKSSTIVATVKGGKATRTFKEISIRKLVEELQENKIYLIDARSPQEYQESHISGASKFCSKSLPSNKESLIVVYADNKRSKETQKITAKLAKQKYKNIKIFKSGFDSWQRHGGPTTSGKNKGVFSLK